jgi:hypothetical protein
MAKRAGSIWIETDGTFHWVDQSGNEYSFAGVLVGSCAGISGSIWVQGMVLYYVVGGYKYYLSYGDVYGVGGTGARIGSLWMYGTKPWWIDQTGALKCSPHADWTNNWSNHSNTAHANVAHNDWTDHSQDIGHGDWDNHADQAHTQWWDIWDNHSDWGDWLDGN